MLSHTPSDPLPPPDAWLEKTAPSLQSGPVLVYNVHMRNLGFKYPNYRGEMCLRQVKSNKAFLHFFANFFWHI